MLLKEQFGGRDLENQTRKSYHVQQGSMNTGIQEAVEVENRDIVICTMDRLVKIDT